MIGANITDIVVVVEKGDRKKALEAITEEELAKKGIACVVGRGRYDMNPRGQILGATGGLLKLLFEAGTLRLLGAHIAGYAASELIHTGQAFLDANADAVHIAETLYNYPSFSDMYRHAALVALLATEHGDVDETEA